MKKSINQSNYDTKTRKVQLKIDEIFAQKIIPENDSVRRLDEILDEIDYRELKRLYTGKGRPKIIQPQTLFKIMVYANMQGIYASREIEKSCKRDINFIWLLNGEKAPNHHLIARFRSTKLSECLEGLFYQLVEKLEQIGEIKYEHLFVDGTKIEANANKYSFVWAKSVGKYEKKAIERKDKLIKELNAKYLLNTQTLKELLSELNKRVVSPFVYGRGRRKSEVQRDIEELTSLLNRLDKYEQYQNVFKGRNSFSKTDKDATFMRLKEDHMRNAQLKPAYNVTLGVEGEYIVGVNISSERSDQLTLIPLLEKISENIGTTYETTTLDAGYESEENYTYFEDKNAKCFIKPQNYEKSKKRKYKSNMALRENMVYDEIKDEYTCQNNKKLRVMYTGKRKSKSGFISDITYYECENCKGCSYKNTCTKAKENRKISVSKKFIAQREKSLKGITSPLGVLLRTNRSIQVEGAFGVIKQNYNFRQFLLRGNKKVYTEILLITFAYNINKLHNKTIQNRNNKQLHEKLLA